jgi:hypothetical protein
VRAERSAIRAKGGCGLSGSAIVRSYSQTQGTPLLSPRLPKPFRYDDSLSDPAIALAAFLGPSLTNAMIAIGVSQMPVCVHLTRGQVLSVKLEEYVEAAHAVGNPADRVAGPYPVGGCPLPAVRDRHSA